MTRAAVVLGPEYYMSGVHADEKAHVHWLVRLAPAAVALVALCSHARGAPPRPTSLMRSGQVATYGQRNPTCQDPLIMSFSSDGPHGNYAMCCREFIPLPLFSDELVEVKVKLDHDEDLFQIKLEDDATHLFLQDGPAKAGIGVFRKSFPKDERDHWTVKKLCIAASGDYSTNRIEVLSARVMGATCSTIQLKSPLQDSYAAQWNRALDVNGLRASEAAELDAVVQATTAPRDGQTRILADIDLRTRDGLAATGHGEGDDAIVRALSDAVTHIRAATGEVTIRALPSQAEIELTKPIHGRAMQSLTIGCIAPTTTVSGHVTAPGYTPHDISVRAADNHEFQIDLVPIRDSRIWIWVVGGLFIGACLFIGWIIARKFAERPAGKQPKNPTDPGASKHFGVPPVPPPISPAPGEPVIEPGRPELPPVSGRKMIAVIGIDDYEHCQPLRNAARDAAIVEQLFKDIGFEPVASLLDRKATRNAIEGLVLNELRSTLGKNDSLILFFAGHGTAVDNPLDGKPSRLGYLFPVDGLPEGRETWIDLNHWLNNVSLLPAKHILVMLDSCYSGIALDSISAWHDAIRSIAMYRDVKPITSLPKEELTERAKFRSRKLITSAHSKQLVSDAGPSYPTSDHSLFVNYLIRGLRDDLKTTHSYVSGTKLGHYLQEHVEAHRGSGQTPLVGVFYRDECGDLMIPLASAVPDANRAG